MKSFKKLTSFFRGPESGGNGRSVEVHRNFAKKFELGKELGKGNFSVVREARDRTSGDLFAVKCMQKKSLTKEDRKAITSEVSILMSLDHPNIIKVFGMYEDDASVFIVTELLRGGELFDRIVQHEYYSEGMAARVVKTMAEALAYCDKKNVVHRDLKPENVLLVDPADDLSLKLADFGFAEEVRPDGGAELTTTCGTPGYVAPEILKGQPYGREVDMWSLGVIAYILLCGYPPFFDDNQNQLFAKIKKAQFEFDKEFWGEVSDPAKDLIRKLLQVDPAKRLTARDVLKHPWIVAGGGEKDITPALKQLRGYLARRRLKRGANVLLAASRLAKAPATLNADTIKESANEHDE
jgi:serine/threonine protein kinase